MPGWVLNEQSFFNAELGSQCKSATWAGMGIPSRTRRSVS